jgi:GDPmannose 4,6-dehydratase
MTETILITGVTGMVGSHLADHIIKQGSSYKVVGTKRWRSSLDNISHHAAMGAM